MKTINKYLCDVCGMEYSKPEDAIKCESQSSPEKTDKIQIGDDVTFTMEAEFEPGSSLTYVELTGKLLHKVTAFNDKKKIHEHMLFCSVVFNDKVWERGVILINHEKEGEMFFAPVQYAYKEGFVELMLANGL